MIAAFLAAHAGALIGLIAGAAGIIFGLFRHQQAKATTAAADQKVAEAQAQVAKQQTADAQANTTAAQAGSDATAARTATESVVSGMSTEEVKDALDPWTRS
ncbi:hypothetical protein MJS38_14740 [Burkholderia gladioli]|uniref:Uncharacterized protein n=1 Tax=Burkholderia gladioli TaxID=28095 RepID=A0A2A7S214_BURGA|nr:hypothetical protein [Burkholderia gladioli]MBU9196032.1 hypothetical protein [Burkholderia gladioli]MBU9268169.1 hypothetical protein [Burkholderia gladioli]MBU9424487.1 hypothetical protein [Burkholderia gladioli]MDN7917675.1 hypothetical protein [Burkholderia gladioli]MDN8061547.1 hypothetical protein [Burkholderia gladioli]